MFSPHPRFTFDSIFNVRAAYSTSSTSRAIFWLILCGVVIFAALPVYTTVQAQTGESPIAARFEAGKCLFRVPASLTIDCGWLVVAENRRMSGSAATIRLPVAIFRADPQDKLPDPIVYLEGGPGGASIQNAVQYYTDNFARLATKRDFIMFDQRGVGASEPSLECNEMDAADFQRVTEGMTAAERDIAEAGALASCRDRLIADGVDIAAYNSAENAADVEDLRITLGVRTWNLYGISYGTRLALTVMRDYPRALRSVILDSTYPLQVNLYQDIPSSANRALAQLFDDCGRDRRCNRAFPKLGETFTQLVADLNEKPGTTKIRIPGGKQMTITVTGSALAGMIFELMYITSALPYLPAVIYEVKNGDYERAAEFIYSTTLGDSGVSTGMYYSVQCAEEIDFLSEMQLKTANEQFLDLGDRFDMSSYFVKCQNWNVPRAAALENEAVISNVPTLVMAGQYDPITPPTYGELAASTLQNSYFFEFPGVAHGASVAGRCPVSIVNSFLDKPTRRPASACIKSMTRPAFVAPSS